MRIKFRLFSVLAGLLALAILISCSTGKSSSSSSASVIYVTSQTGSSISAFSADLNKGTLTAFGSSVATGAMPIAMVVTSGGVFVANRDANTISSYAINSDGSLATGTTTPTLVSDPVTQQVLGGMSPTALAVDPQGKFLYVAAQGTFAQAPNPPQAPGTISAFSISGTSLTAVGAPVLTETSGATTGTGPVALAVSGSGNYLYVANQFNDNVSAYKIGADATANTFALTALSGSPYPVGTAPAAVLVSPGGAFLYVANAGSNNVSAFQICDQVATSCLDPTNPDGTLLAPPNSVASAPTVPVALAADSQAKFLFVVDNGSNTVSEFKISSGDGTLTASSTASISTGSSPVSGVILAGTSTAAADFLYVTNNGSASISSYIFSTTTGLLGLAGSPVLTDNNPLAVGAR